MGKEWSKTVLSIMITTNVWAAMARADIVRRHATQTKAAASYHIVCFTSHLSFFFTLDKSTLCVSVDMCAGGPCMEDDHCKEGLYCDGGKNGITVNCDGVCLGEWRGALVITQTFPHFTYCYPCMFNHS